MHHTEEVVITVKGLAPKATKYVMPKDVGRKLVAYIEANQQSDNTISAIDVFPELGDDIKRPAAVLRGLRHRQQLTQKELANRLGIHQHHLSEMENGKRGISKEMAKQLAAILKADRRLLL